MAEIIGILASIITLGEAAGKLSRLIHSLRKAPEGLLALNNEVTDLNLLLLRLHTLQSEAPDACVPMSHTTERIKESIDDLTRLVDHYSGRTLTELRRAKWAVEQGRINRMKDELRERRSQLLTFLTMNNLYLSSQAHLSLSRIQVMNTAAEKAATQRHDQLNARLDQILTKLNGTALEGAIMQSLSADPSFSKPARQDNEVLTVELTESHLRCSMGCNCQCHRRTRMGFWSSLFMGYTGSMLSKNDCDKYSCSTRSPAFGLHFTYVFPMWIVRRSFSISLQVSRLGDLALSIKTRNILPQDSPAYEALKRGHSNTIMKMLSDRTLDPNSVLEGPGLAILACAVDFQRPNVCEILVRAGADPLVESHMGVSALDEARMFICSSKQTDVTRAFSDLFQKYDDLSPWQLTNLHRAILGTMNRTARDQLALTPFDVNTPDNCGRTPLWWACRRGDSESFKVLLEHDADPNIPDQEGFSPFLITISRFSDFEHPARISAVRTMIRHGAQITASTNYGHTVLFLAAWWSDTRLLEFLLTVKPDLDVNPCDEYGNTPLICACRRENTAVAKLLLHLGVNVGFTDTWGENAFHIAARRKDAGFMKTLLAAKDHSGLSTRNYQGLTPLEIAVKSRRHNVVSTILESGIDPDTPDANGCTPLLYATRTNSVEMVKMLVHQGADIHLRGGPKAESPLFVAVTHGVEKIVQVLLNAGAVAEDLYGENSDSDALSIACTRPYNLGIVRKLVSHFPGFKTRNPQQNTILHFATARDNARLLKKLNDLDLSKLDLSARNGVGRTAAEYLEEGQMMQERKRAFCKLLHGSKFAKRIVCPECGKASELIEDDKDSSEDEGEFVDCETW